MKVHSKTRFENENMFSENWKVNHSDSTTLNPPQIFRPFTISARYSTVLYVGPLGKEVDWLIHLWHAISLSASPLYYGRVWVRLLQPHCTYLHYLVTGGELEQGRIMHRKLGLIGQKLHCIVPDYPFFFLNRLISQAQRVYEGFSAVSFFQLYSMYISIIWIVTESKNAKSFCGEIWKKLKKI